MVELRRLLANSRIEVCERNKVRAWSIHTTMNKEELLNCIRSIDQLQTRGNNCIKFVIRKNKATSMTLYTQLPMEHVMGLVQEKLRGLKRVHDVKQERYQLFIKNARTRQYDSKMISFSSRKSFDDVFQEIDQLMQETINKEDEKKITFVDDEAKHGTHCWQLVKNGMRRSRTIRLDGYSSSEIMELLKENSRVK